MHKSLDKYVRVLDYKTEPTKDGRLQIRVRLASDARTEVTMIAHTDWFDDDGGIIEQGSKRIVMLPKGAVIAYEDASFSTRARWFTVDLRPARTIDDS